MHIFYKHIIFQYWCKILTPAYRSTDNRTQPNTQSLDEKSKSNPRMDRKRKQFGTNWIKMQFLRLCLSKQIKFPLQHFLAFIIFPKTVTRPIFKEEKLQKIITCRKPWIVHKYNTFIHLHTPYLCNVFKWELLIYTEAWLLVKLIYSCLLFVMYCMFHVLWIKYLIKP